MSKPQVSPTQDGCLAFNQWGACHALTAVFNKVTQIEQRLAHVVCKKKEKKEENLHATMQ